MKSIRSYTNLKELPQQWIHNPNSQKDGNYVPVGKICDDCPLNLWKLVKLVPFADQTLLNNRALLIREKGSNNPPQFGFRDLQWKCAHKGPNIHHTCFNTSVPCVPVPHSKHTYVPICRNVDRDAHPPIGGC